MPNSRKTFQACPGPSGQNKRLWNRTKFVELLLYAKINKHNLRSKTLMFQLSPTVYDMTHQADAKQLNSQFRGPDVFFLGLVSPTR